MTVIPMPAGPPPGSGYGVGMVDADKVQAVKGMRQGAG